MRIEKDLLGSMEIPDEVYYGVQTTRAIKNFAVSGHTTDELPTFIHAIAQVKKAAALANCAIGAMEKDYAAAIAQAADEIAAGKQQGSFPHPASFPSLPTSA